MGIPSIPKWRTPDLSHSDSDVSQDHHKSSWKIEDLIDFEYYRMKDKGGLGEDQETRDRAIFGEYEGKSDRSQLFRYWLERMRTRSKGDHPPGAIVRSVFAIVALLSAVIGLMSGGGVAYATLQYDGTVPVNVATFFGFLVLPQLILTLLLLGFVVVGCLFRRSIATFYFGPRAMMLGVCRFVWNVYVKYASPAAAKRDDLLWSSRMFNEIVRQNHGIVTVRVFRWVQQFGVFFNLAILLCSGVLLMFSDRAFGWQSSLTDSPAVVSKIVNVVAWPWEQWLGEGIGYPSQDQIEGSHIVLRDREKPLEAGHLTSWWPFLLLGIVFYGLIPRLVAWAIAGFFEVRILRDLRFDSVLYRPLWERMHSASLQSSGNPIAAVSTDAAPGPVSDNAPPSKSFHLWISEALKTRYSVESVLEAIRTSADLNIGKTTEFSEEEMRVEADDDESPLLLLEGWQPPIQEKLSQLKTIALSPGCRGKTLYLLLIGKPAKTGWKVLDAEMIEVWNKKVRLLGVENLHLLGNAVVGGES